MALPDSVLKELALIKCHQEYENSSKINNLDEFPTESSSSDSDSDSEIRKTWRPKGKQIFFVSFKIEIINFVRYLCYLNIFKHVVFCCL